MTTKTNKEIRAIGVEVINGTLIVSYENGEIMTFSIEYFNRYEEELEDDKDGGNN